ncbi:hypothetical protein BC936DRAFT_140280 [Jimgerdemannia flammicorona]|uniref:Galactose oxidase n=1 Tax=Jimgerdemannia flammicorona TaxID=994334 RepID=A0A433AVN1_9FUNG|nr:hypothetical protein BC936DRAFT_140280 [Jimgerdemannia flammicorona]
MASISVRSIVLAAFVLCCLPNPGFGSGLGPGGRYEDACTVVYNNTLYVWGARLASRSYSNFTSTALPLSTSGPTIWTDLSWDIPSSLANKQKRIPTWPCVVSPNGILLVGGQNMFGYDLVANAYVSLNFTNNPLSLVEKFNVRVAQVEDSVYVFGGYNSTSLNASIAVPSNVVSVLNMTTWSWSMSNVTNSVSSIPPNYDRSSLIYGGNGFIYMFGGSQIYSNSSRFYYAAIYRFNIEIKTWSSCKPAGKWKIGFDSAVPVRFDGMIYLFHGGTNDMPPGQRGFRYRNFLTVCIVAMLRSPPLTDTLSYLQFSIKQYQHCDECHVHLQRLGQHGCGANEQ